MIVTTNATGRGSKFELICEKLSRYDSTPVNVLRPTISRNRVDEKDPKSKIVSGPNPTAVAFLTAFGEAAKVGITVQRISDLAVRFTAGEYSIDMRSENKGESTGLAHFETLKMRAVLKQGALTIEAEPSKPGDGEDKAAPFVGAAPKTYEEMADADLVTLCGTRGIDAYNRGPGGESTGIPKPRTQLIKALRATDAAKSKK